MQKRRVKAAPGRLVRDPKTMQPLPEDGAVVPWTLYWRRRFAAGDVVEAGKPQKKKRPQEKPAPAQEEPEMLGPVAESNQEK